MTDALRPTRRAVLGGTAAALAAGLAPRRGRAATPLRFQLDWKYNAQFAGLFLAEATGGYAAAGLDVAIAPWADGVDVVRAVAEGAADLGCAEQNLIVAAQAEGAPVRAVATMFQASPYGLMAPAGTPLATLADLAGKRVGVHVDGVKVMALVKGVNGVGDIEVVEIPYADKFARALSGEFAAVQCYVIDEPIGVRAKHGAAPAVLEFRKLGFESTAQTIVASDRTLAEKPQAVRAFLAAAFDGWRAALADKAAAARIVVERFVPEGSPYKDLAYQTETLTLLEPYVLGAGGIDRIGVIDRAAWARAARAMHDYGIVAALPDLDASVASEFFG